VYYVVKQGDHLSSIARDNGFSDYRTVWNHANNADLRAKRDNPNVLLPGDRVFIPPLERGSVSRGTDSGHRFKVKGKTLKLRLVLEDLYEHPIANAACVLVVEGSITKLQSDRKGAVERFISPADRDGYLVILDAQTPFDGTQIGIRIGYLDPVEEIPGQQARLKNLGYFFGEVGDPDPAEYRSAVEEFQCDFGLGVDGVCGRLTQAKLKAIHGC
jgi:hypothetical protein